jgi:hypothetical protein
MFDIDLLVIEVFDPKKNLDEYEFSKVPIWVCVYKLPLGMMNRDTGEDIGAQIIEFMEVDGLEDGLAVGKYMRIKVRLRINKPLMRGTTVIVDDNDKRIWCPFEYEFLPDFCFVCGVIGHIDIDCKIKLKRGDEPQFGKWLKWMPEKKQLFLDGRRRWPDRVSRNNNNWVTSGSASDAPSWKKNDLNSAGKDKNIEEGRRGVASPPRQSSVLV